MATQTRLIDIKYDRVFCIEGIISTIILKDQDVEVISGEPDIENPPILGGGFEVVNWWYSEYRWPNKVDNTQ